MAKREPDLRTNSPKTPPILEPSSDSQGANANLPFNDEGDQELLIIEKTFRIAVSGDVFITKLERRIIDTKDFQRLRGVRQLGNVLHVYPTALHTRFDHSLGTLAMADRMIQAIKNNGANNLSERNITVMQEVLARLYALLHDITHIPFGHTIEDELQILDRHDENPLRILHFLGPSSEIGRHIIAALGNAGYSRFMKIYLWEENRAKQNERQQNPAWKPLVNWLEPDPADDDMFIHDLVSNTACADLLDYVARDNYFCNLGIGLEYRFINFLYLSKPSGGKFRRVFVRLWKGRQRAPRRDTMTDLGRLLEARYMIAERAYFHHTKIISGAMLGRALQEQLLSGLLKEEDLYDHSDDSLLRTLRNSESTTARRLAEDLMDRKLYKMVRSPYGDSDFSAIQSNDIEYNAKNAALEILGDAKSRRQIENEFAEKVGGQHGDVLIYAPALDMNPKAANMNVRWNGLDMKFRQIDDPIMKPRLQQIIDAHHMLWGIQILATDRIAKDEQSSAILHDAFQTEFLCTPVDQEGKKQHHNEQLIEFGLTRLGYEAPAVPYRELKDRIRAGGQAMAVTAKDDRPFEVRLRESIEKYVIGKV